jgi:predicted DNA-binding transcriptional regulator YafY
MRDRLGLPVVYSRRQGGYAYSAEDPPVPAWFEPAIRERRELEALQLAAALARSYLDQDTSEALNGLCHRLTAAASQTGLRVRTDFADEVVFTGPPPLGCPHLRDMLRAIRWRRVLEIDYRSPRHRGSVTRQVEPHFLVNASGDWLLVAWDREQSAPRTFALARIEWQDETGETFARREPLDRLSFTRHQFLSEGGAEPYELVLRFKPHLAQIAQERKWAASQQISTAPDGRCDLTLTVSGQSDVLRWILGFGAGAEALSPPAMRRLVAEETAAMSRHYRNPSADTGTCDS